MKTIRLLLATALILPVIISCSSDESNGVSEQDKPLLEKTYNGEFFSLDYPAGFTPLSITENNPGVILSSKDTDLHIEAYSNWNSDRREDDLYSLWHNGEDYWDELSEVKLGEDSALFAYTKNEFEWTFISVTIPRDGWEMIATVTNFSTDEFMLAREIVMSLRIIEEDYSFDLEGPQYEQFDHNRELTFSDNVVSTEALQINVDGAVIENNYNKLSINCDGFEIYIDWIDDWMMDTFDIERLMSIQNWDDVNLGAIAIEVINICGFDSVWTETLKESEKTISIMVPLEGGYISAVANSLDSKEEILSAGSALYSIRIIDHLQFRSR